MSGSGIRGLIREAHRRSVWQVLSIYLVTSWVVLQVVETLMESAGLPDWVAPFALVLLLIGLPIVLATAIVQEGGPGGEEAGERVAETAAPESSVVAREQETASPGLAEGTGTLDLPRERRPFGHPLLTWRNAILGGVMAFGLLGVFIGGYFVMRATGVGPVASLAAQGVFDEREPVVLADFTNTTSDPTLADVVTEALRVDLTQSTAITLLSPATVAEALTLMGRDPGESVGVDVAREIAVRRGLKAAVVGEVGAAGSGYVLTASIVEANSGEVLAPFRVTAASEDEVLPAIEKLSEKIREKAGESLRMIRAGDALAHVTTSSVEALRKYVEAQALTDEGQYQRAVGLLEDAIALDPGFAMAYRQLSVTLQSSGGSLAQQIETAARAYELRDRLTEVERNIAAAYYHRVVTGEKAEVIQAYENVLAVDPDNPVALNNLAISYQELGEVEKGLELLERAIGGPGESGSAWVNLVQYQIQVRDLDAARSTLDSMLAKYPNRNGWNEFDTWMVELHSGNFEEAHALAQDLSQASGLGLSWNSVAISMLALTDAAVGKPSEASDHLSQGVAAYVEAGRPEEAMRMHTDRANLEFWLVRDRDETVRLLNLALDDGLWEAVPIQARGFHKFLEVAAVSEAGEVADRVLETTEGELAQDPGLRAIYNDRVMRRARAFATAASGDPGEGARILEQLNREVGCVSCDRALRAYLHLQAGDTARAMPPLEDLLEGNSDPVWGVLEALFAHELLGEIHFAQGRPAEAAPHYAAFAEAWADAEPAMQPRVRLARERAAAGGS
jgi:tetratricopeptide (TPR) repeat protein